MKEKQISRPTMREVASLSGTSLKTVSRVFNQVPSVDPLLRDKVLKAAKKLNYIPNMTAGSLRRTNGKTNTIGVLLEDIANPFSSALYRIYEDYAAAHGYMILAGSLDENPDRELELVNLFISRRVDGLLIAPSGKDHAYLKREVKNGVHFGFVDRPPVNFESDVVISTNATGAFEAVKHLISYGHRKIAYLGDDPEIYTAQERYAGYAKALKSEKIPLNRNYIYKGFPSEEVAVANIRGILRGADAPTAFFTSQNLLTLALLKALRAEGLQEEIAFVGFDDLPTAELISPGITIVKQDIEVIGRRSIEMLFERVNGITAGYKTEIVPTSLIQRGSGEIRAH